MQGDESSTNSTEDREWSDNVQSMIDWYTSEMIDLVWGEPYASTRRILEKLAESGPCPSKRELLHLFGGPAIFKRTVRRMEVLRWAVVADCTDILPLDEEMESFEEMRYRHRMGIREEYMISWAPARNGINTFPRDLPEGEGRLVRYPSQDDTDVDLAETEEDLETTMTEDVEMEDAQQLGTPKRIKSGPQGGKQANERSTMMMHKMNARRGTEANACEIKDKSTV